MKIIKSIIAFFIVQQIVMANNNMLETFQEDVEEELFEGDIHGISNIEMSNEQDNLSNYHEHISPKSLTEPVAWPNGIVPYEFFAGAFSYNEKKFIIFMMERIQNVSCVRFTSRDTETDYMEIRRESVHKPCHSFIGYRDTGAHELYLQNDCMNRNGILHELMHAIGFYHEHNRYDRNYYVKIIKENIHEKYMKNFKIRPFKERVLFEIDYDFSSITHYPNNAFAINLTLPTIIPKHGKIIQVDGLSELDIKKINLLYKCDKNLSRRPIPVVTEACSVKCSRWNRCHFEIVGNHLTKVSTGSKWTTDRAGSIQVVRRVCGPQPQGCKCTCSLVKELCNN